MQKLQETITQLRIYAMNISKGILLTFNTFSKPLTEISITYGKPEDYKHIDNLYNLLYNSKIKFKIRDYFLHVTDE